MLVVAPLLPVKVVCLAQAVHLLRPHSSASLQRLRRSLRQEVVCLEEPQLEEFHLHQEIQLEGEVSVPMLHQNLGQEHLHQVSLEAGMQVQVLHQQEDFLAKELPVQVLRVVLSVEEASVLEQRKTILRHLRAVISQRPRKLVDCSQAHLVAIFLEPQHQAVHQLLQQDRLRPPRPNFNSTLQLLLDHRQQKMARQNQCLDQL